MPIIESPTARRMREQTESRKARVTSAQEFVTAAADECADALDKLYDALIDYKLVAPDLEHYEHGPIEVLMQAGNIDEVLRPIRWALDSRYALDPKV